MIVAFLILVIGALAFVIYRLLERLRKYDAYFTGLSSTLSKFNKDLSLLISRRDFLSVDPDVQKLYKITIDLHNSLLEYADQEGENEDFPTEKEQ